MKVLASAGMAEVIASADAAIRMRVIDVISWSFHSLLSSLPTLFQRIGNLKTCR